MKVLLPERCQHCGRKLPQKSDRVTTEGEPRRHQVTEIPEINPHTTEYPCPQVVCEHGQKTTQEPLPEEVRGNFGPLDGADRLLDGGLSGAATAGGNDAGRCAGPGNQFGEHSESLGGSQPGGRAALSAMAGAVAARSSAERGRDGLAQQRRQALDLDIRGQAVSSLVSVSRRPAGSAGESAADQSASAPSEIDALAEEAVRLGRDALGPRQQRSAESGHRALCSLRAMVYLSRSERRRAYQQ